LSPHLGPHYVYRLLDHAGGRLLDLPEREEKGGEEEKKEEKSEGKEGKKGRKGRPLLDYYYPCFS
jgi:hypothetical protein